MLACNENKDHRKKYFGDLDQAWDDSTLHGQMGPRKAYWKIRIQDTEKRNFFVRSRGSNCHHSWIKLLGSRFNWFLSQKWILYYYNWSNSSLRRITFRTKSHRGEFYWTCVTRWAQYQYPPQSIVQDSAGTGWELRHKLVLCQKATSARADWDLSFFRQTTWLYYGKYKLRLLLTRIWCFPPASGIEGWAGSSEIWGA